MFTTFTAFTMFTKISKNLYSAPYRASYVSLPHDVLLYRSNSRKFFKNIYRTLVGQVKQHCHRSPGADGDNWGEAEG